MALKAGTQGDMAGSMAQAIENAFKQEWPKVKGEPFSGETGPELQLIFTAVAQGIIRHLVNNPTSFMVEVEDTYHNLTDTGNVNQIEYEGTLYV